MVDRDEHGIYIIVEKSGILSTNYSRDQFDLSPQQLSNESDLKSTATGRHGLFHCDCSKGKKQCQTNSRCHCSVTCQNKN